MSILQKPDDLLKEGRLDEVLQAITAQVRTHPADPKLRIFLFQVLALLGQWERAQNQLKVSGELDSGNALLVGTYSKVIQSEMDRASIFTGAGSPSVIGEPKQWLALLFEALKTQIQGNYKQAAALRAEAFSQADAVSGSIDGAPFEWLADGDARFGPCMEVILTAGYFWVPFSRIHQIQFEAPTHLRDKVWVAAEITWSNGGKAVGFVSSRYPGSETSTDSQIVLAHKTEWLDMGHECFVGRGQRMLTTESGDYPLLDIRNITLNSIE